MKCSTKKLLSIILIFATVLSMIPVQTHAAAPSVNIVSFMRGAQTDLRSSELLWAEVTGYDGNVQELTYKWTNTLGTSLYVYNTHNMYGVNNTDGEHEIYPSGSASLGSMEAHRVHQNNFSGTGFAWAAIYGANLNKATSLKGTVKVEVYTPDGTLLCSDSHTGTVTQSGWWWNVTYTNHGFVMPNLQSDLENAVFGLFEGETLDVRDLLGRSSIVHIHCIESSVTNAKITSANGTEYISLTGSEPSYMVTGLKKGSVQIQITVEKNICKFHEYSSGTANPTIHVFKKPIPIPTTTTITLSPESVDPDCEYFIQGVKGEKQPDGSVLFTDLTPNTKYEIEVRAQYQDNNGETTYVYAYVDSTTLPVYLATVNVYLDGVLTPADEIHEEQFSLVLQSESRQYVLEKTKTAGVYTTTIENGTYYLWHISEDHIHQISNYPMIIENANATKDVHHYSVTYDTNGGAFDDGLVTNYAAYYSGNRVEVLKQIPVRDGFSFAGWQDENGNTYEPNTLLTEAIGQPYKLTALWEEAVDLYVNINLQHVATNGEGHNNADNKHNISFTVDQRPTGSTGLYTEIYRDSIIWDGISELERTYYDASAILQGDVSDLTAYEALTATVSNVPKNREYTFTTTKSGYALVDLLQETAENGDIYITANLVFDPHTFDFTYTVELDEEARTLPQELKPVAVNIRVTQWFNTPYDEDFGLEDHDPTVDWYTVTQQRRTYTRVELDENGQGAGSYPVWTGDGDQPYYYRIEIVSYELPDGTLVDAEDIDNAHINYNSVGSRYTSDIVVTGGQDPDDTDSSSLTGAWYENAAQQGQVKGIIHIPVYDVTFIPNGGILNGTQENTVVEDQIVIPQLENYVPVRDGGYVFAGWYVVDEHGNTTDEQVVSGGPLTSDLMLIAQWKDPRHIYGTVTVSGTYEHNGNILEVNAADRPGHVLVILQEMRDGTVYNVASQTATITWPNDGQNTSGIATYQPFAVPDDGKQYRVDVRITDYVPSYQNESTAPETYNEFDYTAVFQSDPKLTFVNAYLSFYPDMYYQPCEIISEAIGAGFRPQSGLAEIFYTAVNSGNPYALITQHTEPPYGAPIPVNSESGYGYIGEDPSTSVWKERYDGVLYEYQMDLSQLVDHTGTTLDRTGISEAPFYVTYGQVSRYSPANDAPTGTLQAILTPKQYAVIFELGASDAKMDAKFNVYNDAGTVVGYATAHIWSYETDLSGIIAERPGYFFGGWYLDPEFTVSAEDHVDASVAENTTLYAKWIPYADTVNLKVIIDHGTDESCASGHFHQTLYTQLTSDNRSNRDLENRVFADVEGYSKSYSDWHSDTQANSHILDVPGYYTGLSPDYDYNVNVTMEDYYVVDKTVEHLLQEDGSTVHNVVVTLRYAPELMHLDFYVQMDESVPQILYPLSAEVKVTSWHDSVHTQGWSWEHIPRHHTTTVTVTIDPETGNGTGTYPVWQWYDDEHPYSYRIEVVQLNLADGSTVTMNADSPSEHYQGSNYYADIQVTGGSIPGIPVDDTASTALQGVYGQENGMKDTDGDGVEDSILYTQVGTVGAVIDIDQVVFHANNPEFTGDADIFRTYYYHGVHQPEQSGFYTLNKDDTITAFYDIPTFEYFTHNQYIFKGWYLDADNDNDSRPINWTDTYSGDVDIYAHWIYVGQVDKEAADQKIYETDFYIEYDLIGNQIRTATINPNEHYGQAAPGLRFVTALSERVYSAMNAIHQNNSLGVEYGFVMGFASAAEAAADSDSYMLKYKHTTVNGENTTVTHSFVNNIPCRVPDVPVDDHYAGNSYRLYTAVITYNNLTGAALNNAQNTEFIARSYMRYFDANGLERVHYNNYTGQSRTFGGVKTCFTEVYNMVNGL